MPLHLRAKGEALRQATPWACRALKRLPMSAPGWPLQHGLGSGLGVEGRGSSPAWASMFPGAALQPAQARVCLHDRGVEVLGLAAGLGMAQVRARCHSFLENKTNAPPRVCRQEAEQPGC